MELILVGIALSTFTTFSYLFIFVSELKDDLIHQGCWHDSRFDRDETEFSKKLWKLEQRVEKLEDKSNDRA